MRILTLVLLLTISTTALAQDYGKRLPPPVSAEAKHEMDLKLKDAQTQYESNPNDPDALIWLGRRLAYPGRFAEAIDTFSLGIKKFPKDARFYRHRGHRYITLRQFDRAILDLSKAAALVKGRPDEIEPDGQPNARNVPTSTLQFNIWYHLGLAYYLSGDNRKALNAYRECLKVSQSPDRLVSTSHWLYMTLKRLHQDAEAAKVLEPINSGMDIVENASYHRLLLMYKGEIPTQQLLDETLKQAGSAASHSSLYGIGNWYLYNGKQDEARAVFRQMLASDQWTSFGFIAAEVDMKKL
jgi:tetratricopeptide (TPR) repeat protein